MAKFNANVAVCPAVTVSDCDGPVTEKLSITKLMEFEAPPPGAGLDTVTPTEPVVAISVDAMLAVRVVPLFETVPAWEVPLKISVEPVMNPVPVAVSGLIAVPVGAVVGEMEESTGTGLVMVKLKEFDAPPPGAGLVTMTGTTAADGNSVAGMAAVMVAPPLETTPALLVPLKLTVAPDTEVGAGDGERCDCLSGECGGRVDRRDRGRGIIDREGERIGWTSAGQWIHYVHGHSSTDGKLAGQNTDCNESAAV